MHYWSLSVLASLTWDWHPDILMAQELHLTPAMLGPVSCCSGLLTGFPRWTLDLLCRSLHLQSHIYLCSGAEGLYLDQQGYYLGWGYSWLSYRAALFLLLPHTGDKPDHGRRPHLQWP